MSDIEEQVENEELGTPPLQWVPNSDSLDSGNLPEGAVEAGSDGGKALYVIRAELHGALLPGKLHDGSGCYVPWDGQEHSVETYEVLVATSDAELTWIDASNGTEVPNAVKGGYTEDNETLYIGRVIYLDMYIPGKIQPSHGCCYISYDGREISSEMYQVLCELERK